MPAIVIPAPINSNHVAPVAAGGTGANTAANARTNLDVYSKSEVTSAIAQSTANFSTDGIAIKLKAVANTNQGDTCYFDFYTDDSKHYKLFFGRNGNSGFQYYDGSTWETLWQHSMANIGTVYTGTGSVSSVANNTYTEVLSVSVPAGNYIVIRGCDFGSNATGMRRVGVDNGSGRADFANMQAVSGFDTVLQHIQYVNYSSQTSIKCTVYQSSGTTLNIWPYMYAIRIA